MSCSSRRVLGFFLVVVIAAAVSSLPSANAQWGQWVVEPQSYGLEDIYGIANSYWQNLVTGLGIYTPPQTAAPPVSSEAPAEATPSDTQENPAADEAPKLALNTGGGVDAFGEAAMEPGPGYGAMDSPYTAAEEQQLLGEARLQIVELLLNLTRDTYYEVAGADAQAVAYDYDSDYDSDEPMEASEILSKVYSKIVNASESSLFNYSFNSDSGLTEDLVIRAIERLPDEVRDVIRALNETLVQTENSLMKQRIASRSQQNVANGPDDSMPKNAAQINRVDGESVKEGRDGGQCMLQDIVQRNTCLGKEDQDDCYVSIMLEAWRKWNRVDNASFSILFMPSDSAILRMLKFAQVSPGLALKKGRMKEVIKRHSLLYNSVWDNPLEKIGIGQLLTSKKDSKYTVLEFPQGMHANAPNVTLMMERDDEEGSTSLFITTKKPDCELLEYRVEKSIARFYTAEEECMRMHLQECTNPSPSSLAENENPCGIAQLLGVTICSDGIVLPINDLLFDSEQTANFLALLSGTTQKEKSEKRDPVYEWSLTTGPPEQPLLSTGSNDERALVVGNVDNDTFSKAGMQFDGFRFLYVPKVRLNDGGGSTMCVSLKPSESKANGGILHGSGDSWNFTVAANSDSCKVEDNKDCPKRLSFQAGPVSYTSTLVLGDETASNVAIVIDESKGSWSFYVNGWMVDTKPNMPKLPPFEGELLIGRSYGVYEDGDKDALWKGSIKDVKLFEQALLPEEIARFCNQDDNEDESQKVLKGESRDRASQLKPTPSDHFGPISNSTCLEKVANHVKEVAPSLSETRDLESNTMGILRPRSTAGPQYLYELTRNGSNTGLYGPSSYAYPHGFGSDSFTPNGVHFDGMDQYMTINNVALREGKVLSIGFTFSLDRVDRARQTMFQMISTCGDRTDLYFQLKVNSHLTGLADYFLVSINGEVTPIEIGILPKRKPVKFTLKEEGGEYTFEMEGREPFSWKGQSILPTLMTARLGSPNSFAGTIKDVHLKVY